MLSYLLLTIAAFFAGALNAVAGGGSFLTFPSLFLSGVPAVAANATNTVALFPGSVASAWAYRKAFRPAGGVPLWALCLVSLVGGVLGAELLLSTSDKTFEALIPWLLLFATLLFTFGNQVRRQIQRFTTVGPIAVLVLQFLVTIYGGYFGAGIGILMLAVYGLFGLTDIHAMNALKTLLSALTNGVAVVVFVLRDQVFWPQALVMAAAAIAGGYLGAVVAQRVDPKYVRWFVSAVGIALTIYFFVNRL